MMSDVGGLNNKAEERRDATGSHVRSGLGLCRQLCPVDVSAHL